MRIRVPSSCVRVRGSEGKIIAETEYDRVVLPILSTGTNVITTDRWWFLHLGLTIILSGLAVFLWLIDLKSWILAISVFIAYSAYKVVNERYYLLHLYDKSNGICLLVQSKSKEDLVDLAERIERVQRNVILESCLEDEDYDGETDYFH